MALAKERGAYPIFRIHPIVYEFYCLYYIFIFRYSLIIKTNQKVPDARNGDDGVQSCTPHPSGISTTDMFSLRYACDNMGLCVSNHDKADGALSFVLVRHEDLLTQMLPYSAAAFYSFTPNSNSP